MKLNVYSSRIIISLFEGGPGHLPKALGVAVTTLEFIGGGRSICKLEWSASHT